MTKESAIYNFWNQFLTAYEENTVPEDASFPYITYQLATDSFGSVLSLSASLWYRSESWLGINSKTKEISDTMEIGALVECDGGYVSIEKGTPFAQNMGDESDSLIKRKYLNVEIEFITDN